MYFLFYYSWFLEQQLNRYKLILFPWLFIHQVFFFVVLFFILAPLIIGLFVCIDLIGIHWSWHLSLGVISNCQWDVSKPYIQISPPPAGFWMVVVSILVGCSDFFSTIDCFAWYKISSKLLVQDFFHYLLTCVYHIYWISVHWYWNLS